METVKLTQFENDGFIGKVIQGSFKFIEVIAVAQEKKYFAFF